VIGSGPNHGAWLMSVLSCFVRIPEPHIGGPAPWATVGPVLRSPELLDRVGGLVAGLLDDAAVFPPGDATVPAAVAAHLDHRRAWYADLVGPLLVRASQVAELVAAAPPGADLRVGLVADTGLAGLAEGGARLLDQDDRAELAQVEIALPAGHDPGAAAKVLVDQLAMSATAYVEVPRSGYEGALDVLADDGAERAKYRTGGLVPEAFPGEDELAGFLLACLERALPFKLTAGLHHALRCTVGGLEQHGFLNVLAAVEAGRRGATPDELARLLGRRDADPLVEVLAAADVAAVRSAFVSFGCCGVTDPVDDLVALGLLAADAP